jgi:hypothetical protein
MAREVRRVTDAGLPLKSRSSDEPVAASLPHMPQSSIRPTAAASASERSGCRHSLVRAVAKRSLWDICKGLRTRESGAGA